MSQDKNSQNRKVDHIELAFKSQTRKSSNHGMVYEPMLSGLKEDVDLTCEFAGKILKAPLWISSMTGGAPKAQAINKNLAKAAGKAGIGMGLGSCRPLLESDERLADFQMRKHIGDGVLFANLGIAQIENLVMGSNGRKISEMVKKLEADGLIVHVNPLQEYMQPEGDQIAYPPIDTIKRLLDCFEGRLIVKEVGQGIGPASLLELCKLPLEAVEFGAFGGTNFTKLEQTRHEAFSSGKRSEFEAFADVGHLASEMVEWINQIMEQVQTSCRKFIISGGIESMVQGRALRLKLKADSLIGMGASYLEKALVDTQAVESLIEEKIEALKLASKFLRADESGR